MDTCNECGAHYMQTCSWWCGLGLTKEEILLRENPQYAIYKELKKIRELLEQEKNGE